MARRQSAPVPVAHLTVKSKRPADPDSSSTGTRNSFSISPAMAQLS
jgi:hypothetical protein